MNKIEMKTPLVEMDGDEMTRILWTMIKDELLLPFIDLKTEYYDLGLEKRNETNDQITVDAANATKKYGVAVKCATITPNAARMEEYDHKKCGKARMEPSVRFWTVRFSVHRLLSKELSHVSRTGKNRLHWHVMHMVMCTKTQRW